jgi:hypothetical protein
VRKTEQSSLQKSISSSIHIKNKTQKQPWGNRRWLLYQSAFQGGFTTKRKQWWDKWSGPLYKKAFWGEVGKKAKQKNRDDGNREVNHTKVHSSRSKTKKLLWGKRRGSPYNLAFPGEVTSKTKQNKKYRESSIKNAFPGGFTTKTQNKNSDDENGEVLHSKMHFQEKSQEKKQ